MFKVGPILTGFTNLINSRVTSDVTLLPPGFSREDFVSATVMELIPHIRNFNKDFHDGVEGAVQNNDLFGWVNTYLGRKAAGVLTSDKAGTKAVFEQSLSDDESFLQIQGDLDADVLVNEDVIETSQDIGTPLLDNIKISQEQFDNIVNTITKDVGVKLPDLSAQVSKNKFTTPFIAALKKAFGVKNGPLHRVVQEVMGKTPSEVDAFLVNPKNKKAILEAMPTSWLAKNLPKAVVKSVDGTRVSNPDNEGKTNIFTPKWTKNWEGQKIDRHLAADEGPYRGNTSGPQVMKRNPDIDTDITPADIRRAFVNGTTMTEIRRGGLDALQLAFAQELGLEAFRNDLKSDGPIKEVFRGRQELFDRALAENHVEEITRQMARGTAKFSIDANSSFDEIKTEAIDLLKETIKNFKKDTPFSAIEAILGGYSQDQIKAFEEIGIFDLFDAKTKKGFAIPTKEASWPIGDKTSFVANSAASAQAKIELAEVTEHLIETLDSDLLKVLPDEFFGLTNRLLDPAATKKDSDGKTIPGAVGEYNYLKVKLDAARKKLSNGSLDFDASGYEMLNSSSGIMSGISTILSKDYSDLGEVAGKQKKLDEIQKKFGDRINNANEVNHKVLHFVQTQAAIAIAKDPSLAIGFARLMQGASSNVKGFRGATTLDMIKVSAASQAPFMTKDGKPTKENTGLPNTSHPDYQRAFDLAKGETEIITELLKFKGEHIDPSANVMQDLFMSTLDLASKLNKVTKEDLKTFSNEELVKLAEAMEDGEYLRPLQNVKNEFNVESANRNDLMNAIVKHLGTNYGKPKALRDMTEARVVKIAKLMKDPEYFRPVQNKLNEFNLGSADLNDLIKAIEVQRKKKYSKDINKILDVVTKGRESIKIDESEYNNMIIAEHQSDFSNITTNFAQSLGSVIDSDIQDVNLGKTSRLGFARNFAISDQLAAYANTSDYGSITNVIDTRVVEMLDIMSTTDRVDAMEMDNDILEERKRTNAKMSKDAGATFNGILEATTGVEAFKTFSEATARKRGQEKGKYNILIPPSAEDFKGLLYQFLGKGAKGDKDLQFFNDTLLRPFARADREINIAKQTVSEDYRALKKAFPDVKKKLGKIMEGTDFTWDAGARVYLWNKFGMEIPGISKSDQKSILSAFKADPSAVAFADALGSMSKQVDGYVTPTDNWTVETIASDLDNVTNKIGRKKFLAEFVENREAIFGEWKGGKLVGPNMNKIEAIYGTRFREALNDMLWRMENGTNRSFGDNRLVNQFSNWVNNSVGAIMFLNARSAVLQTLSTVNFVNWSDNNVLQAGKAFANQPQFWKDFAFLFNSPMLKQRRKGLKTDVNQAELANAAAGTGNKAKAAFAYLLKIGFTPTQIADSFAIASGGATFYRNRVKTYLKQGMSQVDAEAKAFIDFQEIAEETQQSSRPDLISQQQASPLGRLVLAFQNTPMQYMRLTKKAIVDLANGRGDVKTNISKIIYYGAVQNLIFASLQKALFALAFDDDEEDEEKAKKLEKKGYGILNSMADSILRGMGVGGAIVSTLKNMILKFAQEDQKGWNADYDKVVIEFLNLSPPIGSKARKLKSAFSTWQYKKDAIKEMDKLDIDNPIWYSIGNVVSALTNVPLDRTVNKVNNLKEALDSRNDAWQRLFLSLGWNSWDLGVEKEEIDAATQAVKDRKAKERKAKKDAKEKAKPKATRCTATNSEDDRCGNMTRNKAGLCYAHD